MTSTNPKDALADDALRNPASSYDPFSSAGGSLPLLVKMPDGERHQVDIPANSSVRDLKDTIASMATSLAPPASTTDKQPLQWDLGFAGSILNDNHSLEHYHIPDAYDHANGLLKTISDSGYGHPEKKVEALDKAYAVVQGISRGERDMERLINSVFNEADDAGLDSPSTQPSITAIRRSRRSRIPSLNLNHLPPIGSSIPVKDQKGGPPSAPPTPSQLIRRLSNFRPDLYDPTVVAKATAPFNPPAPAVEHPNNPATAAAIAEPALPTLPIQSLPADPLPPTRTPAPQALPDPIPPAAASNFQPQGSGELKRGNTWFTDVISSFGNSNIEADNSDPSEDDEEVDGDSEGEGDAYPSGTNSDLGKRGQSPDARVQNGNIAGDTRDTHPRLNVKSEQVSGLGNPISAYPINRNSSVDQDSTSATASRGDNTITASHQLPREIDEHIQGGATSSKSSDTPSSPSQSIASGAKSIKSHGQVIGLEPDISMTTPTETVHVKIPKKRGRKRKNPHLSEEERKAQRQAQNRESAKLSRIRRKNMTMEYEKRVNTLEGENENLRDTVAALTDRLEMLQNLLTISVQKRPIPPSAMEQLATAQHAAAAAAVGRGQISMQQTTSLNMPGMGVNPASLNVGDPVGMVPGLGVQDVQSVSQVGSRAVQQPIGPLSNLDFNHLQ